MTSILSGLKLILGNYETERKSYSRVNSKVPSHIILSQNLPKLFVDKASLPSNYLVKGSIGQLNFNFAGVPWICFYDREITTSAQKGYYVCLLFREDMEGFHLSLNQGWTQYENEFGVNQGREEIELNSIKARSLLRSTKDFQGDSIDLRATTPLSKGYERGNIYSRYYAAESLPDDKELLEDLQQLLGAYRELKGLVGENILNIRALGSEDDFQIEVQNSKPAVLPSGPISKPNLKLKPSATIWPRSQKVSKIALENSNYQCEFDTSHNTFTHKQTGKQFLEVHHLVPMEKQSEFAFNLDVPENIIALCPNCHRMIHLSSKETKEPMLTKFLNSRTQGLYSRGIIISLNELNQIYKNIELD
jgi:5-methylcytosine-specific restriction enzyme A